jgi:hypothetical protein
MGRRQMGQSRRRFEHSLQHARCPHSRKTVWILRSMHTEQRSGSPSDLAPSSENPLWARAAPAVGKPFVMTREICGVCVCRVRMACRVSCVSCVWKKEMMAHLLLGGMAGWMAVVRPRRLGSIGYRPAGEAWRHALGQSPSAKGTPEEDSSGSRQLVVHCAASNA